MMPGEHPVGMLAESLARFSREALKERGGDGGRPPAP